MESLLFTLNLIIICGLCYRAFQIDNADIAAQKQQAKAAQHAMLEAKLKAHRPQRPRDGSSTLAVNNTTPAATTASALATQTQKTPKPRGSNHA
jgi:hypothetical protein